MSKIITCNEICNEINNIYNENDEMRSVLCADIVFTSKYIKKSVFPPSKIFGEEILKIYNIICKYYPKTDKIKNLHPYLKNKEAKDELDELSKRTDPEALSIILTKVPKYRNILSLFDLYSIMRIIGEFNVEYGQYIKSSYFEERLKLFENKQ